MCYYLFAMDANVNPGATAVESLDPASIVVFSLAPSLISNANDVKHKVSIPKPFLKLISKERIFIVQYYLN